MFLGKDYVRADTHIHIKPDGQGLRITQEKLIEQMSIKGINGAIVLAHSIPKTYAKDFKKMKNFCKNYSNLIPGVEISKEANISMDGKNYKIKCHAAYLGEIPAQDMEFGSWFCHVGKPGGLFIEANRSKIDETFFFENISRGYIMESTMDLFNALGLKSKGFKALLGTDSHPDKKGEYNILGSKGILVQSDDFTYESFMDSLKSDSMGYFSIIGKNYYYFTIDDFLKDRIIIKKN